MRILCRVFLARGRYETDLGCAALASSGFIPTSLQGKTLTLICNLLFIVRRQRRRLGKADNLVAFSSSLPLPHIIQGPLCGKTNGMIAFCCIGGWWWGAAVVVVDFVFHAEFKCSLTIQSTQAMTAARIVQIMMHGRDQIKIYQLRVEIHL